MNYQQRKDRAAQFCIILQETLNKKGNDYASNEEAFSNFRNTANCLKIRPEKVFLSEIIKKVSRIVELLEKEAANESIYDSVLDIAGYACLLDGYLYGDKVNDESRNIKTR